MRNPLPNLGVLALVLGALAASPTASAQERKVLKAHQVEGANISEEYLKAARAKRLESIQFLKQIIAEQGSELKGDKKAEMMLRLADLYFQQGRDEYLSEMQSFDKIFDKCFNTEGCDTEVLKADNSESQQWQTRSVKLYEQILTNYPRYARADEATFYLGQALSDMNQRDRAKDYFENLVRMYPESGFVPDSYVNLGEYYFDTGNAYKALTNYKKATAFRDHDKYGFALYKLGWSYYNVGDYGQAIDSMKSVVSYSTAEGAAGGSKLQLQDEALKDLVRFFADAGELDEAYDYFKKLGKDDLIRSMLKQLAGKYFENGKFDESVQTYRRLIAENPSAPECPDYQNEIVQAYQKMGKKNETFTEIDRMLKTYGRDSAWAKANSASPEAIKSASEMVEKNIRQVAYYHHKRAKDLKGGAEATASYDLAYKAYSVFLREFPNSTNAYEVHASFAELLWATKKYDEAFNEYMAVVKLDAKGPKSEFCAESAIFAAEEMVKAEGGGQTIQAQAGKGKEPQPLTQWEQNLVAAAGQYADLFPTNKKVKNVIYKSAYLLYNKYRFTEAADQFQKVIKMDPASNEAELAANLILDSFVINEDWANLQKNAKFYYEQEGLGSSKFKKDVFGIYQRASLKIIEVAFDADKNYLAAADAYVGFAKEFPDSEENARILNNATVYYHKVEQVQKAMEVRRILLDDPRFGAKTKYYYAQLGGLGYDYETVADFQKAAGYYEQLFAIFSDAKRFATWKGADEAAQGAQATAAADALYSAAVFRKALGDADAALKNYGAFIAAFPTDARVNDVKLTMGKIQEERGNAREAANIYLGFYTKPGAETPIDFLYFARLHYAQALEAQGQGSKAAAVYQESVAMYQKYIADGGAAGAQTEFVAEMMFKLAQPKFDEYMKLTIGEDIRCGSIARKAEDKATGDALKKKATTLVETEKLYADIIKTGAGEWGLAGLVMLGRVYDNMGQSLLHSHVPCYLTDDQREIYGMAIEDKVYPQTEKAVAAYSSALDKSYDLTLYNENTAYAARQLGVLRPNDYPGLHEELPEVRQTSETKRSYPFATAY